MHQVQLRSIVQREAPLRIGEPRGDGFKREREPAHIEIDPTQAATRTDVELEAEHLAKRPQTRHRRLLPPAHPGNQVRGPDRLDRRLAGRPPALLQSLTDQLE